MRVQFTTEQANILVESLDVAVKQIGLKGIYTIVELFQALQVPVETTEESRIYDFTEEQLNSFTEILDITTKSLGLNAAVKIMEVVKALQTPVVERLQESVEQEVVQP